MGVPERRHGDAGIQVEVALAGAVPDVAAFTAHQHGRRLAIVRVELGLADLVRRGLFFDAHSLWLSAFVDGNRTPRPLPGFLACLSCDAERRVLERPGSVHGPGALGRACYAEQP